MALISPCSRCGTSIAHRASEVPMCYKCSGKDAWVAAEKARWAALTIEEKLDELKERLDSMAENSRYNFMNTPIG